MQQTPVTVIVSSFNRPKLLPCALKSVRDQLWPVQLLVADDWSTMPEVGDVCDDFQAAVVRPAFEPNQVARQWGMRTSEAINAALPFTTGTYLVFLPDDDELTPDSLAVRAAYLDAHPEVQCVYGRLEACKPLLGDPTVTHSAEQCQHDRDGFWSAEPIKRAANRIDHGMMMVRVPPEGWPHLPQWPTDRIAELIGPGEIRAEMINPLPTGSYILGGTVGEVFDCPDAAWFFRLERAGRGPFHSVPEIVIRKRYHRWGHRTNPARRE